MDAMPMSGDGAMSMAWMPMCGQSWSIAAASFLGTWTIMMAAMMLPSLVPMLWRYRQSVGRAGRWPRALLTALFVLGYFLVWTLLGAAVYPLGSVIMAVTKSYPELARALPLAGGLVVLTAGVLQFTSWKAHHLACCSGRHRPGSHRDGCVSPADPSSALRHGLRLGVHCCQCCAGLTAILLVSGIMDVPAMLAVTAAITLERLAPAGKRVARAIGVLAAGVGMFLIVRGAAGVP
jgi:predicted metal-binding membrane protein